MSLNKFQLLVCFALNILLLSSCGKKSKFIIQGEAQGTFFNITVVDHELNFELTHIDSILNEFDKELSTYIDNSLISKLNQSDAGISIENTYYFSRVFEISSKIYELTDGAFDPSIMPLVEYWGFGREKRDWEAFSPDSLVIDSLLNFVGYDNFVHRDKFISKKSRRNSLDYNAIAQGYAVDVLSNFLQGRGHESFLIELGGEIIAQGYPEDDKKWTIGVDLPQDNVEGNNRELIAKIQIENAAVATSGNYRKYYMKDGVKYAHTINPKTGYPVQHPLLSATVIMEECSKADAYATAFMVMGKEKVIQFLNDFPNENIDVLLMYSDENGEINTWKSEGMKEYLIN